MDKVDNIVENIEGEVGEYKGSKLSKYMNKFLSYTYVEPPPNQPLTIKDRILKFFCVSKPRTTE